MKPILYSYRRCPYAMRARMALKYAGIQVEHREIELRDKPHSMLLVSPKATVPVLCIDELVLDQSLDIMSWALRIHDPDGWCVLDEGVAQAWVDKNDGPFKILLDQYKYPDRHPDLNQANILAEVMELMFEPMETALRSSQFLLGNKMTWVDVAIFPFIRQFSKVNQKKFDALPFPQLQRWLSQHLESALFQSAMDKYPVWRE